MGTGTAAVVAVTVGLVAGIALFIAMYARYRGKRIVTCPETHLPVSTDINAALAAATWLAIEPRFVVTACSRWPERAECDQACAPQIAAAPEETLVRNIVTHWYASRTCVYCARPVGAIGGMIVPALLSAEGELREWKDVAPEDLPRILENAVAVCAACEVAEGFRRHFPDRVINRPVTPLRNRSGERRHVIREASRAIY